MQLYVQNPPPSWNIPHFVLLQPGIENGIYLDLYHLV